MPNLAPVPPPSSQPPEIRLKQITGTGGGVFGLDEDGVVWSLKPGTEIWQRVSMRIDPEQAQAHQQAQQQSEFATR